MSKTLQQRKDQAYSDGFKKGWQEGEAKVQELRAKLDAANAKIANDIPAELAKARAEVAKLKEQIRQLMPGTDAVQD